MSDSSSTGSSAPQLSLSIPASTLDSQLWIPKKHLSTVPETDEHAPGEQGGSDPPESDTDAKGPDSDTPREGSILVKLASSESLTTPKASEAGNGYFAINGSSPRTPRKPRRSQGQGEAASAEATGVSLVEDSPPKSNVTDFEGISLYTDTDNTDFELSDAEPNDQASSTSAPASETVQVTSQQLHLLIRGDARSHESSEEEGGPAAPPIGPVPRVESPVQRMVSPVKLFIHRSLRKRERGGGGSSSVEQSSPVFSTAPKGVERRNGTPSGSYFDFDTTDDEGSDSEEEGSKVIGFFGRRWQKKQGKERQ